MKSPKNLILYKDFENGNLFYNMTWIMENYENEYYNKEDVESLLYESLNQLMELAVSHGFEGNLWHSFLAFILVNNENAYSKACEIRGEVEGSVNQIVLHDFEIIKSLFDFDFGKLASYFEMDCMDAITDYQSMTGSGKIFNKRIKERINELKLKLEASTDVSGFKDAVTAFYKDFECVFMYTPIHVYKYPRTSQGIPHSAQGKGRGGDRADHKYCPCEIRRSGRL